VSWQELLDDLAPRIQQFLDEHGPDAVGAFIGTASAFDTLGRQSTEQLLRALGSRQKYTSLTVDAVAKVLAAELMGGWSGLNPVWDEERCRLLLVLGHNPVVSHGHTNAMSNPRSRLRAQARRGELWVVDPRSTETAKLATGHLQARPGSDYALLAFLVRELLQDGADRQFLSEHAIGTRELAAAVQRFDIESVAAETDLPRESILDLLAAVRRAGRIAILTGTGVDMSAAGSLSEWLSWALAIVTGSLDRPGGMWFNPGYLMRLDSRPRRTAPPEGRAQPGPQSRPELPGRFGERPSVAITSEIEAGNLHALFVVGGNPLRALPDSTRVRKALESLDVLVVADVAGNEMSALATHVLPCTGQLERPEVLFYTDMFQATVMSQYTPRVVAPVAERKPLWWALGQLGRRLGCELYAGTDLDALSDDDLLRPILQGSIDGQALVHSPTAVVHSGPVFGWVTDKVLPDGRWRLAPAALVEQLARTAPVPARRFVVTSRRTLRTMNSQLRTISAPGEALEEPDVLVNPDDAQAVGVVDGGRVRISSPSGAVVGRARVTGEIVRGAVSMNHGWVDPDVCRLTSADRQVDPITGMVLQSGIAVDLSPVP